MRSHTHRLRPGQDFYTTVIADARRAAMRALAPNDPVGREIALLRLTLQDTFSDQPYDLRRILRLIDAIVRLVLLRHRLSGVTEGVLPLGAARAITSAGRLVPGRAA